MGDLDEYIFDDDGNPVQCPYPASANIFADEEDKKDIFHIKGDGYDVILSLARGLITWSNVNPSGKRKGIFKKSKHVDKQTIMLRDVFGAKIKRKKLANPQSSTSDVKEGVCQGFNLHIAEPFGPNVLHDRTVLFEHPSEALCNAYIEKIDTFLAEMKGRPQFIKLFLQPYAGAPVKGKTVYKNKVQPLFEAAGVDVDFVELEHNEHVKQEMVHINLDDFDCVVAMGGDGTVNKVVNGLMNNSQKSKDLEPKPGFTPVRARVPLGIIPTGTTNDIVRSIHGTDDIVTAVLRIIMGHRMGIDVCSAYKEDSFYRWFFNAQYGFAGNVLFFRNRYKSIGKRALEPGFIKALTKAKFRSYKCDIEYIPSEIQIPPNRQYQPCYRGCDVCWYDTASQEDEVIQDLVQPFDPLAESHERDSLVDLAELEDTPWKTVKDDFVNVSLFTIPGRSELAPRGISKYTHLNDGAIDLVLIKDTPRKEFIRVLKRLANSKYQFDFPFIETIRVKEVKFKLRLATGYQYSDTNFSEIDYEMQRQKQMDSAVSRSTDILEIDSLSDDEDDDEMKPTNGKPTPKDFVQSTSTSADKPKPFKRSQSFQPTLKRTNTESSIDVVHDLTDSDFDSDEDNEDAGEIVSIGANGVRTVRSASAVGQQLVGPQYRMTFAEQDRARRRRRAQKKEEKKKKKEASKNRALWNIDSEMKNEDVLEFKIHHGLLTVYGVGVCSDTEYSDHKLLCLPTIG